MALIVFALFLLHLLQILLGSRLVGAIILMLVSVPMIVPMMMMVVVMVPMSMMMVVMVVGVVLMCMQTIVDTTQDRWQQLIDTLNIAVILQD